LPTLQVLLLGRPQIRNRERPVHVEARKAMALLAYLALSPTVRGRDELAVLLWPEHPKGRARLRHALWAAKKAIGQENLIVERESIGFRHDKSVSVDVLEFRRLLAAHQFHGHTSQEVCQRCLEPLTAAVNLYRADFLSGFSLADSSAYDDWQSFQTESLRQEMSEALGRLVRLHSNRGEFEPAIEYGRRRLTLDPLNEPAERELMRVYAWADRAPVALRQYEEFVARLDEEIGVPPEQETIDLAQAIRGGGVRPPKPGDQEEKDAGATETDIAERRGIVQNLPVHSGSFFGRSQELDELTGLLQDDPACRLLTVLGLGGVGKTALAIRLASQAAGSFEQGAVFVPLTQIDEASYLPLAIANAVGIPIRGSGEPAAQLVNVLRNRELLLVLDNFEQLLDGEATGLLVELLAGAGRIKLLVTSRERLNLGDEWGFELGGLHYPAGSVAAGEPMDHYPAVELFLQEAHRVAPIQALTQEDRRQVLRICRLVDGLPLALKLAAGWSRIMTLGQIPDEIERNLDFLESTQRDIPDRHQNIRAAFNHSWALISDVEREAFMNLSVFRGGFSSRAADRVAAASLHTLLRLADKSLIQRGGDGRFHIHQLLRRYASEHLEERPAESEAVHNAHADYYAMYLSRREEEIQGVRQEKILAELTAEHDNIRAAWNWSCNKELVALLERGAECFVHYFGLVSRFQEGRMLCGQGVHSLENFKARHGAEDDLSKVSNLALAQLLIGQAYFTVSLGHPKEAQRLGEESVRLFRQIKPRPRRQLARSLLWLGEIRFVQAHFTRALELLDESLELHQQIGDKNGQGHAKLLIGTTESYRGDYQTGREFLQDGANLLEVTGNRRIGIFANWFLGSVARTVGDFDKAGRILDESMQFAQSVGLTHSLMYILREASQLALDLGNDQASRWLRQGLKLTIETSFIRLEGFFRIGLGVLARRQHNFDEARQQFEKSIELFRESSEPRGVGIGLQNMGDLAFEEGRFAYAEQFYRQSVSQFEAIEHRLGVASALCGLGGVITLDPTRHGAAREHFQRALSLAEEMGTTPVSLEALVGLASLASEEESSQEQAAEWLGQVVVHPSAKFETRQKARLLLEALANRMGREHVDRAVRRGEARELDEILAEAELY
jgi:predicted ATPase/DNA-binding SARP family transcriptional activator